MQLETEPHFIISINPEAFLPTYLFSYFVFLDLFLMCSMHQPYYQYILMKFSTQIGFDSRTNDVEWKGRCRLLHNLFWTFPLENIIWHGVRCMRHVSCTKIYLQRNTTVYFPLFMQNLRYFIYRWKSDDRIDILGNYLLISTFIFDKSEFEKRLNPVVIGMMIL